MESYIDKLVNPNISFIATYICIVVVISYLGLFFMYLNNQKLQKENLLLKQQFQGTSEMTQTISTNKSIDLNK